jgi:hypothetical protein
METTKNIETETETENTEIPEYESLSEEKIGESITLELGDIIEINAPTNPDIHEMTFMIQYIDDEEIQIINVASNRRFLLKITPEGRFTDESITDIFLLDRSEDKGYARQNSLLPKTWVDVYLTGEVPVIISGEITNLEEDMIEITTFPELRTIYINFGYNGLPQNIPIEKIIIREKPASLKGVSSLNTIKNNLDEGEVFDPSELPEDELATMEFTESGESIIKIPENAVPDEDIRENLHDLYIDANSIIFGERLEEIAQVVEVPEGEKRFGIDIQVNDLMDELLSTIPNSQRTKQVLDNIHLLIERFKELRKEFSKFDTNDNIYDIKTVGAFYKPLIEHIEKMDVKLQWLVPVVSLRRKLYDTGVVIETSDTTNNKLGIDLRAIESLQQKSTELTYVLAQNQISDIMTPFEKPFDSEKCLKQIPVMANIDSIVDNLENFYSNIYAKSGIIRQQYVIQRYNLGSSYLKESLLKSGKTIYTRKQMTPNDSMCLKSIIMLPQPIVQFSKIGLSKTSILNKASMHQNYFLLYRLLRNVNTRKSNSNQKDYNNIITHVIDDLTKELDYEKMEKDSQIDFLSGIHEFILDSDMADIEQYDDNEKFNKFLEVIIPKTRMLIRLVRKYIKNQISFVDVVQELEPFMVYSNDITYNQYNEIRYFIKNRILELKKEFQKKSEEFAILRNTKYNIDSKPLTILRILSENTKFAELFYSAYKIIDKNAKNFTAQEILSRIIQSDEGKVYFNIITTILISLITPNNLMEQLVKPNIDDISDLEKIKPTDCTKRYLAKKYTSMKDLQKDNNIEELYFDKDFDDTPYDIIKLYEKERKGMAPELFVEFLEQNLIKKHNCPKEMVASLASVLIAGKKRVTDGEYAMLEIRPTLPENMDESLLSDKEKESVQIESNIRKKTLYYRRLKNNWINDDSISENAFIDTNTLFCNISKDCFKNSTNNICESVFDSEERIKELNKKRMLTEFDRRYEVSVEELEDKLQKNIEYHMKTLIKNQRLKDILLNKANNLAFILGGLASMNDIITSPYLRLRDLILGQDDFTKKQYDVCRFVEKYGRDPLVEQEEETPGWKYCKETNTKLFPLSLYQLAETFVSGGNYQQKLEEICHDVGILSDDGDSIVDKKTGYVLRKIDFSNEEGFDEGGFRVSTNDILEKDLGTVVMEAIGKKEKPVFENPTTEMIYNIFSTICSNIGIPLEKISEFVLRISSELIEKYVWREEIYKKKSADQEKKTGKPFSVSYKNYRNESIISITTSVLLIAIQTATPSFQAKKSFPGCVKSFSGYPLEGGVEDFTAIRYMACVLNKTKSVIEPWTSIQKYKVDALERRLKDIIEKQIMIRPDINELYVTKRNFMLLNPETVAPDEHSIRKWLQFEPPLVQFEIIKSLRNVASDFKNDFMDLLRKGNMHQYDLIATLKGKIIQYGYGINEAIDGIVISKELLLKTMSGLPFTENACCNDKPLVNPITYFNEEDNNIALFLRVVNQLVSILSESKKRSIASLLYHPGFTGINYPTVPLGYLEDDIYAAIMKYCNFDRNLPIPEQYKTICSEKPPQYNKLLSFRDKVESLKRNGKRYGIDDLNNLMRLVNQKNTVDIEIPMEFNQLDVFKEIIEKLDISDSKIIDAKLREHLMNIIEKYVPSQMMDSDTKELENMKRYLSKANKDMYNEIINFFGQNGNLYEKDYEKIHDFMANIYKWNFDETDNSTKYYDEGLFKITQFIKNSVHNISKVYPSILINDATFYKNIPKHWELSEEHVKDIGKFIDNYYESIEKFKGDKVLMTLLNEVTIRLVDINQFLQNIPINTDITKTFINEKGNPEIDYFHSLFDKKSIYMLYSYCFYSVIFEYIACSTEPDMLRTDIEELKMGRRNRIKNNSNPANLLHSEGIDITETNEGYDNEIREIQITTGDVLELKSRVSNLLITFLNVEQTNKTTIDFSYEQVIKRVSRSKEKEKRGIIEKLGNMSIEERKVEDMLKNRRLGRWNVGQQKGLFMYDQNTYDRERNDLISQIIGETQEGSLDIVSEDLLDIYDLDKLDEDTEEVDINRETYDIGDLDNNFMDGVYYEEDRDEDETDYY